MHVFRYQFIDIDRLALVDFGRVKSNSKESRSVQIIIIPIPSEWLEVMPTDA